MYEFYHSQQKYLLRISIFVCVNFLVNVFIHFLFEYQGRAYILLSCKSVVSVIAWKYDFLFGLVKLNLITSFKFNCGKVPYCLFFVIISQITSRRSTFSVSPIFLIFFYSSVEDINVCIFFFTISGNCILLISTLLSLL